MRLSGSTPSSAVGARGRVHARARRRGEQAADRRGRRRSRRSRRARAFELGEHRAGPGDDRWRQPGELGDGDAVAAVGGAVGDLVEQDQIALPFARADVVERQSVEPSGEPRQLVIMGREEGPALTWSCIASTTAQAIASPS